VSLKNTLCSGLEVQSINISNASIDRLISFISVLSKWNKVYNLTAVRDENEMVVRHLLDSLTMLPFIKEMNHLADLGSGAGLPGIPLAICCPEKHFTLVDSNSKKTAFLQQAVTTLALQNVTVKHTRVEEYYPSKKYDCLISRAFAAPAVIMQTSGHMSARKSKLVLMVGRLEGLDLTATNDFMWQSTERVQVYNETSTRHVVTFIKDIIA
jgi:16S rRNA (guanine527-N7)-methyltransferase